MIYENEFKMRRKTYYALNPEHTDSFDNNDIKIEECELTVVQDAKNYISTGMEGKMCYPGKSYAIATLYASWLSQICPSYDIFSFLMDSDLLNGDDPYFKNIENYDDDQFVLYSMIISKDLPCLFDLEYYKDKKYLSMTRDYFLKEFMLTEESKEILPFKPDWSFNLKNNGYYWYEISEICDSLLSQSEIDYTVKVTKENIILTPKQNTIYATYKVGKGGKRKLFT